LVSTLADAGDPDAGRAALEAWPETGRDARYWRLRGRWDLEYDHHPDRAEASFRRALTELPHDWKTRIRLARTLRSLGREPEARTEAATVARLRERLDPAALGPRLARGDPADLAELTAAAGLTRLAAAWRSEVGTP
jgi:thioredoxin-like negative regulator of GroEL